ncbi:MAG TPA: TadE family protein [Silvibacterium sp.]|nr:TadE family protein [Silvibacterium sp.]
MNDKKAWGPRLLARQRKSETGQSLVEIAVTLPLMMVLLVGGGEIARLAYEAIEVTNAAHAGVQYGAQSTATLQDSAGIQAAAAADASDIPSLTATPSFVLVCADGTVPADSAGPTFSNQDCHTSVIEELLTVTTTATFDPLIHLPGLPKTFTVNGSAKQKVLSN